MKIKVTLNLAIAITLSTYATVIFCKGQFYSRGLLYTGTHALIIGCICLALGLYCFKLWIGDCKNKSGKDKEQK